MKEILSTAVEHKANVIRSARNHVELGEYIFVPQQEANC